MDNFSDEIGLEKMDLNKIDQALIHVEFTKEGAPEIELPGYENDYEVEQLFNDQISDQIEVPTEIEFITTEKFTKKFEEQKHQVFEAITVRLEPQIVSRVNEVRRRTTRSRRERLGSINQRTERLTNNSFYRAVMNSVMDLIENEDFSDCKTEKDLHEKVQSLIAKRS